MEHSEFPVKKKFKSQPSAGNVMLTVVWDLQGPILQQCLENGLTVNSVSYSEIVSNELKHAI